MSTEQINTPKFTWIILIVIGVVDLIRGFMHTVMIRYAAANFAMLDLSVAADDQMFLLGVFGISNYLTGVLFIIIGLKARQIAPVVLAAIPVVYAMGTIILNANVTPQSEFLGKGFMIVYLAVCAVTAIASFVVMAIQKRCRQ